MSHSSCSFVRLTVSSTFVCVHSLLSTLFIHPALLLSYCCCCCTFARPLVCSTSNGTIRSREIRLIIYTVSYCHCTQWHSALRQRAKRETQKQGTYEFTVQCMSVCEWESTNTLHCDTRRTVLKVKMTTSPKVNRERESERRGEKRSYTLHWRLFWGTKVYQTMHQIDAITVQRVHYIHKLFFSVD